MRNASKPAFLVCPVGTCSVIIDWGDSNDRMTGILASNKLEMPATGGETNEEIVQAVKLGIIKEEIFKEGVDRLLELIYTKG